MTTLTEKIRKRSTHEVSMAIDTALREGDKVKMLYKQYAPDTTVWGCKMTPTMLYGKELTVKTIVHNYGFLNTKYRGKRFTVNEDPELNFYTSAYMDVQYMLDNNPRLAKEVAVFLNIKD